MRPAASGRTPRTRRPRLPYSTRSWRRTVPTCGALWHRKSARSAPMMSSGDDARRTVGLFVADRCGGSGGRCAAPPAKAEPGRIASPYGTHRHIPPQSAAPPNARAGAHLADCHRRPLRRGPPGRRRRPTLPRRPGKLPRSAARPERGCLKASARRVMTAVHRRRATALPHLAAIGSDDSEKFIRDLALLWQPRHSKR